MTKRIITYACLIIWMFSSCVPAFKENVTEVDLDFEDPAIQRIYDLKDKQNLDSLIHYLKHPNANYRYIATSAFASFKTEDAIDSLSLRLNDPVLDVRTAAAFALGQIGSVRATSALIDAFKSKDTASVDSKFNSTILEALGKCADENVLEAISTVKTYRSTDTLLLLGQTRAIYRFGLRGITSETGTKQMIEYSGNRKYPPEVRLIAAHYLARTRNLNLDQYKFQIANAFSSSTEPDIKMSLALALGKTKKNEILSILQSQLDIEQDYRVKCNIIRALGNFPYIQSAEKVLSILKDKNPKVSYAAADFIYNHGNKDDAVIYRRYTRDNLHWRTKARMLAAINKQLPKYFTKTKAAVRFDLINLINTAVDPFQKAEYIRALGWDSESLETIKTLIQESEEENVKSAGYEALGIMLRDPDFDANFYGRKTFIKKDIYSFLSTAFDSLDVGSMAVAADIIADPDLGFKDLLVESSFLNAALLKLELPQHIETYNAIERALSLLDGKTRTPTKVKWNHPINWKAMDMLSDTTIAIIKTIRGNIELDLYLKEAPGSVINFADLVESSYYNNNKTHRVVPNFVIQAGCPRGDGYGGLDYTIRSEFAPVYYNDSGYIGMASAGNHTEGTQWFITHSPTPHLDGNYTIFGKVISGMDAVHELEVGDKIISIELK